MGKKLSEMTTRRVIILVLVMLLTVPMFRTDGFWGVDTYQKSAQYASEMIYEDLRYCFA